MSRRVFQVAADLQPNDGEPIRSVVHETDDVAMVAWTVKPGQRISPHVHPSGQDTWTVSAGVGEYQLDASGSTVRSVARDFAVALSVQAPPHA
jgi:quercetin dioxygenase-like cupin family protein